MALGGFEWLLIFLAVLMLFGAKHIPGIVRNVGKGIKEFRKTSNDVKREFNKGKQEMADSMKYETEGEKKTKK